MFYRSIRFKITVLYMAILAITLTSFSAILYHNVSVGLSSSMDTLLASRAGGISQAINTYWETSSLEALESGARTDLQRKRRNINFAKIAQRWVREESSDPKLLDIVVQLFDTDGNTLVSSKNTQEIAEIPKKFISVLQGTPRFDTVQSGSMTLRIFTTPVFENEKVAYIVQVSSPLTSIQAALNNLKVTLLILLPLTVLLTGVMGTFLAKATLRPVDNMIKTIRKIRAESMNLQIALPGTNDELAELAETFNDMLRRLEHAFTSQRQLFEDLSHELKTPLTVLRGELEVALKKARPSEEYVGIMKSALEEIKKIAGLAESLLVLARFDAKEALPQKKRLDLNHVVGRVMAGVKVLAESKGIRLAFSFTDNIFVHGDEDQLKTLFFNILDNAVKYTPSAGNIDVTMEKERMNARILIKDTGVGIAPEDLPRIFDRFYRVDESRNGPGFGLGLSIARSIAEAHGGSISVESAPPKGTTFAVSLPISS